MNKAFVLLIFACFAPGLASAQPSEVCERAFRHGQGITDCIQKQIILQDLDVASARLIFLERQLEKAKPNESKHWQKEQMALEERISLMNDSLDSLDCASEAWHVDLVDADCPGVHQGKEAKRGPAIEEGFIRQDPLGNEEYQEAQGAF